MLPILIICYQRPEDLESTLKQLIPTNRKVYVFIDRDTRLPATLNIAVMDTAKKFEKTLDLKVNISDSNLGVGASVPSAINWIAEFESEFIILEDDCHLTDPGLNFFDSFENKFENSFSLVSGTSPWDIDHEKSTFQYLTYSRYPLISGWVTTRKNWKRDSYLIGEKAPYFKLFIHGIKHPKKIRDISYFLSAHIKNSKVRNHAWDCSFALGMIINNSNALIPNITVVTNTGRDSVAEHTRPVGNEDSIYRLASTESPSKELKSGNYWKRKTDKQIQTEIYGMKARHIFSVVKAILN